MEEVESNPTSQQKQTAKHRKPVYFSDENTK
jgi:hypothetical protein